jgi:apolipoprotein N-acyltransferase
MALTAAFAADALARALTRGPAREWGKSAAAAVLIPAATCAYGAFRIGRVEETRVAAPTSRIALVQPGVEARERWDAARAPAILATLTTLTKSAESRGADLTVWPESAYPYAIAHASRLAPIGQRAVLGPGVRGPVLTGALMTGGRGDMLGAFNAAVLVSANGAMSEPYDKRHLLWFGETVPLADEIPWIRRTFARGRGLLPGDREIPIVAGPVRAAVLNCFEDTLPVAGREAAEIAPNLLVNVTNDAWFSGTAESELHLRLAALRAVELRRDLVRAVNLGVTSWVDATGKVRARYEIPAGGSLVATPALLSGSATVYAQSGDAPWLILLMIGLAIHLFGRRRARA